MAFSINTNVASLQAQNYLQKSSTFQAQTINEVTSGLRIVNSGDDAAGLAIANGFRSDEAVLNQGIQNANNGLATLQTVDGGMNNISTLLDRARTLATESASGTFSGDRSTLNSEFQSVIQEVNRQAQSIGMNQGGKFAQSLSVFIGGGKGVNSAAAAQNGTIGLDLSKSAVDAQSLGLQGVQAAGKAGTDIGSGSATTSVSQILANATNSASQASAGSTSFTFNGPGFADSGKINVSVNLSGVTDATTLAASINSAIQAAGNGSTQQATAFKNANITASVVTDSQGRQQLAFSSSTAAFQVQAGDRTANALMGNFAQNAKLEGTDNNASLSANGLGFSSLNIDGNAVNLSAATVTALAGGAVATSGGVSGSGTVSDSAVAGASITSSMHFDMTVDGVSQSVTMKGGETSLAQIASEITGAGVGVTASIQGSGTTQKLVLTSNSTGSNSNVSVAGSTSAALLSATVTGFTGATSGTPGVSGSVPTATSGSLTSTATIDNTVIGALNTNAGTNAGDHIDLNVNGVAKSITLTAGDKTIQSIATDINNSGAGVTATITGSGSTQQLKLTSNDTGSNSNVSFLASTSTELKVAGVLGFTAAQTGIAGQDATAPLSKGQIVSILNNDANFSSAATASLDGNKLVIQSNNTSATSSVQATGTLATALGFSTSTATAASASTGASLNTRVQGAGAVGNLNQAVIGSSTAPTTTIAAGNKSLNIAVNGGAAVNLTLTTGNSTNAAVMADINTQISHSSLAGQVQASLTSSGALQITATHVGQVVTVGGSGATTDTAAVNLGFTSGGQSSGTASNAIVTSSDNMQLRFSGAGMSSPVTINLKATTAGTTKVSDILADLTSQVSNNSALAAAGISVTTATSGNNLVFTDSKGEKFNVAVTGDTNNVLGLGSFKADANGDFDYSSITGTSSIPTAPQTNVAANGSLNISLNGGATETGINVSLKSVNGTITGAATTDNAVSAAGLAGSDTLAVLVNGATKSLAFAGSEKTLADVAAKINTDAQGVTADIVGTGANQSLRLTATGTASSVTVMTTGSTAAALAATGMTAGQSGTGLASTAAVQQDAANQINAAVAGNSDLTNAGIQASVVGGKLQIASTNGTNFRINGSGPSDLGFGTTGSSYAGTTNSGAPTAGRVDSAGAYTSSSMAFSAIKSGGDSQNIAITANDASGATHSLSVSLQNNATARTGDNVDDAIHAINTALQQSNDSTLQSIVAVKEDNSDGSESIKFQSTTQNFKVAVSGLSDGSGVASPTGGVSTSAQNGSGANVSIDTIAGAEAAVNALSTAVQNLGTAQAAVGKGENLLNYAVSLATSQVTNEAASESQLRDANLAQEAANLTRAQILMQAGTAALAQANSAPQQLVSLLK